MPSADTIYARLGNWRGLGVFGSARPLGGLERLQRIAAEVELVEREVGPSPFIRQWDEFRASRPELGLYHSVSLRALWLMWWQEWVDPDRTWPDNLEDLL